MGILDSFLGHDFRVSRLLFYKGILKEGAKVNHLANLFSCLSLGFGFLSIIFSAESHFTLASWAIIISVIFDGLDGQVARRNPVPSEFGKELDSLVDAVSFGIAPSILGYTFIYRRFYFLAITALFVYLLCSIIRLAKYNITIKDKLSDYFYGLPTTCGGGILASFILIYRGHARLPPATVFLFLVFIVSLLMVSKIKYPNLDGIKQALGKKVLLWSLLAFISLVLAPHMTVFLLFSIYLLFSPFMVKRIT